MPDTPKPPLVVYREARGLSQAKLATLAGISQTLLWKLEHRGHTPKGLRTALALAAVLGVKVTAIWPEAAPQRVTNIRAPRTAKSGAERPRQTVENQGKRKR